jgi:transglutaminase-like putative cysteine protease
MVKLSMMWFHKGKSSRAADRLWPEHPQIQRYFELSLFLLTATGFATLAGTGKIDLLSLMLVSGALVTRALLLLQRRNVTIPERTTNYITLLYVGFYGLDYLLISRQFIPATVHLVLFSLMVKTFSIHRERDYLYIAVLSFAMVLAAAVLTVDSLFLPLFGIFLLLALTTATSMELRRSWAESRSTNSAVDQDSSIHRVDISAPLVRMTLGLATTILFFSACIFFLLPRRFTPGYLGGLGVRGELISGFRDEVQLGEIGRIQQLDSVVMHVTFLPSEHPPSDIRLRGVALSTFHENRWSNSHEHRPLTGMGTGFRAQALTVRNPTDRSQNFRYQVSFDSDSEVVFLIPDPVRFFGNFHLLRTDRAGSIFINYLGQESRKYIAESHPLAVMTPEMERSISEYPSGIANENLQLPTILDQRIRKLAEQITAKQSTKFQKARAIEHYLLSQYGYTLELPSSLPADPLANFLFSRKKGHCEYFSTAMAVMLRTLGIPARIVNGFRGGEYNDITGSYIIRAKDAHSWVEAYFPDYGWYTFDPTPASGESAPRGWSRIWLYADAMREFWQEWVINYDFAHQTALSFRLAREGQADFSTAQEWTKHQYALWADRIEKLKTSLYSRPRTWALWLISIVLSILLLVRIAALIRAIRRFRLVRRPERAPQSAATIWYARLLKLLSRQGYKKSSTHTSQEFARSFEASSLREPVRRFTQSYERARFGQSAEDAARLPELYQEVESATRK